MASRKENIKALFSNTRSRVIILFTGAVLLFAVVFGIMRFTDSTTKPEIPVAARVGAGPVGIESIPGALDPTAQYAGLVHEHNIQQAQQAEKTGGSAIPTIIRAHEFGKGIEAVGPLHGKGGLGFVGLEREDAASAQKSEWIQALKNANCSRSSMEQVENQGATIQDLKEACSCAQLKDNGYTLEKLRAVCSCRELKAAGFNALQFKKTGYSAGQLRVCGFDACQLRNAGYTAQQMKDGGFTDGELKGAGYSEPEIQRASGLPEGVTPADVRDAGCGAEALEKLRASGVSAAAIRRISGCSAAQLKAAGYTAQDLKNAGFSAADLKNAGFSAAQLRNAGYSARDLLNAGFTPAELAAAGYSPAQIRSAEAQLPPGVTPEDVKEAGCSVGALTRERLAGISAAAIHRDAGCTAEALKSAGFTNQDLANAGFTPAQIKAAVDPVDDAAIRAAGCNSAQLSKLREEGVSAKQIRDLNGCSASALKAAGYDAKQLLNAGFTPNELSAAGFTPAQIRAAVEPVDDAAIRAAGCNPEQLSKLREEGVSAKQIRDLNGCSVSALKAAGYDGKQLLSAGFTPNELSAAGFTPAQIQAAEAAVRDAAIRTAGCNPAQLSKLREAGVSAKQIRDLNGCSASALKAAGYDGKQLLNAGFTPNELSAAGFTPAQIQAAEDAVGDAAIRRAGCNPVQLSKLREAGVSARQIHVLNGCSASALKAAGYDGKQLLNAGFTPSELSAAGFTPAQIQAAEDAVRDAAIARAGCHVAQLSKLREEGVSAKQIHELNGCSASALKAAGYHAKQLLNAGFTPGELSAAGFTPAQIRAAREHVDDAAIRAAGCNPAQLSRLRKEGVSAKQIRDLNGCSVAELKSAGYDAKQLANAGFTPQQLLAAGFTPDQLAQAGLTPSSVIATGRTADCSVSSLKAAHAMGVSATTIKATLGCSAKAMKEAGYTAAQLRNAGYTAAELKNAGFTAQQLKQAGFTAKELADAGFTAQQLKDAGFTAQQLKAAGFTAGQLKAAGFSAKELKAAGFTAAQLKHAGFTASQLRAAGFSAKDLKEAGYTAGEIEKAGYSRQALEDAGISDPETALPGLPAVSPEPTPPSDVPPIPSIDEDHKPVDAATQQAKHLQQMMEQQKIRMADQRYQQKLQQLTSAMLSSANQSLQDWKVVSAQTHVEGEKVQEKTRGETGLSGADASRQADQAGPDHRKKALIKTGDVMFAVLDTSVNSDQPSPILATIVSGKLKGAKLIGSFTLPTNSDRLVIRFNTMSVPGAASTTAINAYAIDPNTGRTALADRANHHYLMRYGSLFAATFLEGFGNAFQSANTTVTIGGTGGVQTTSIQSGIGRSILENAVIGLATLGKNWGQVAQQNFNRPTTVEVCSGMGMGILFTQDVRSL